MQPTLVKYFAWIAVVVGGITASATFWGDFGWKIRKDYDAEHIGTPQVQQVLDAVQALDQKTTRQHVHWECDEMYEELPELEERHNTETDAVERNRLKLKIDGTKELFRAKDCINFVD